MAKAGRIIPTDEFLAILNSNSATALNPFATIADVLNSAFAIPAVANYSALPPANTVDQKYYRTVTGENGSWRPAWLGGTYYPKGIWQSVSGVWEYIGEFPFQADQATVDGDTNNTEFVTALTLANYYKWNNKLDTSVFDLQNQTTKEPTGFPNRDDSTFSFNDGTRTFTIQPTGVNYDFWTQGEQHTISTSKNIVLPNVTGKYFIYFDNTETLGYTLTFDDSILNDKVFTATVYFNASTGKGEFVVDERHGLTMDWATHFHLHNAFGTRYYGGFGLSYIIGDGSLDSHGQIALGTGTIADEDIPTTIVDAAVPSAFFEQVLSPTALIPAVYKQGVAIWQKDVATNYPYKLIAGVPQFNLDTLGTHTLEDVTDGNYFAVWIFATPEINTPIISILGGREDADLNDAKNNNTYGTIDWGDLPSQEYKILYRLIYQYDTSFGNTDKVALAEVTDLRGSIDSALTSSTLSPVAVHSGLIGLGADDHTQYYNQTRGDLRYLQISNLASGVLGTFLTGLSVATAQVIASTDTVLLALGYLQAQVTINNAKVTNATHTGDVTGATILTIANDVVTNVKLANVPTQTFKGRTTAATGDPEDLTVAQAKTLLNLAGTNSGDQTSIAGITGTKAEFNTAVTDGDILYVGDVLTSLKTKSGVVVNASFSGNPKKATITFATAFPNSNYSIGLISNTINSDSYTPAVESITASNFVINMDVNSIANLTDVRWIAVAHGEN